MPESDATDGQPVGALRVRLHAPRSGQASGQSAKAVRAVKRSAAQLPGSHGLASTSAQPANNVRLGAASRRMAAWQQQAVPCAQGLP